MGIALPLATRW